MPNQSSELLCGGNVVSLHDQTMITSGFPVIRPESMPSAKITSYKPTLITDPHPIWIISGWPTTRELKHVHAEVAARQAEHPGEGGLTKRELDVLQLIRKPHRNKHVYRALSSRRHLVNLAAAYHSHARHALKELGFKIQREHFGEFHCHGRASVWRSRSDHRQKTLYRFHDDVGNEKRFLV